MPRTSLGDMFASIAERGRNLIGVGRAPPGMDKLSLEALCETLLSSRGEASGVAIAHAVLDRWAGMTSADRLAFLTLLTQKFGADEARLDQAVAAYTQNRGSAEAMELHHAAEPRRQEVIRRLNQAPGGTAALLRLREELFKYMEKQPDLAALDADFAHLFSSWFNRGFLVLRRIDWTTPANILEKIIRYEAVHEIQDWDDLRRRLEPPDRRCFAFFHPILVDEPLIFVEVALTADAPAAVAALLAEKRQPIDAQDAATAVFYSISNCQDGLRGVSFGNFLIKQVVEELRRELPKLKNFVTLSPVPGFARWLERERKAETSEMTPPAAKSVLAAIDKAGWHKSPSPELARVVLETAARYFLQARTPAGKIVDPVARFHLGNGARLERLNFLGDVSKKGLAQAHGLMVNYRYKLDDIEKNHELFVAKSQVVASPEVTSLLPTRK